jgi:hypothetical protein
LGLLMWKLDNRNRPGPAVATRIAVLTVTGPAVAT